MTAHFVLRRLGALCLTLWAASVIVFLMLEIAPGDVAVFMMGLEADPEAIEALRQELGLGGSAISRYVSWLANMLCGDFGISYTYRVPVIELILDRAQVSLPLAIFSFLISTIIAIPLAAFLVMHRGRPSEIGMLGLTQIGVAIPNFWLAILLLSIFATHFTLFPAGGFPGWSAGLWPALQALVLPTFALALPQAAILTRVLRTSLLDMQTQNFVRTARAKGLSHNQTLWRHVMQNAIVPILPIMALQFAFLVAGSIIVETVFYLPGLGRLVFQAITQRDLIVVKGVIIILVGIVVITMFVMDIIAVWLDPRLASRRR